VERSRTAKEELRAKDVEEKAKRETAALEQEIEGRLEQVKHDAEVRMQQVIEKEERKDKERAAAEEKLKAEEKEKVA
jgi:hypothetical protein|tara:strand:+ start:310 stop:540 length:231 start_codon:yes stop_codon:yes gene_type:complete